MDVVKDVLFRDARRAIPKLERWQVVFHGVDDGVDGVVVAAGEVFAEDGEDDGPGAGEVLQLRQVVVEDAVCRSQPLEVDEDQHRLGDEDPASGDAVFVFLQIAVRWRLRGLDVLRRAIPDGSTLVEEPFLCSDGDFVCFARFGVTKKIIHFLVRSGSCRRFR